MSVRSLRARAGFVARAVALLTVTSVGLAGPVSAAWRTGATAAASFTTTTLASPGGLGATQSCLATVRSITLSWTPTASGYATGYEVFRRTGTGAFTHLATLSGSSTTTYVDSPLPASTKYTYYVRAYFHSWTASSGKASATTQGTLCL